ncbi:hypothetical protein mRhiFer1_009459 [Rhinolophus ferrumequinum]|uniref:Uncharacterized protein n=1 Tax=Rhinolophus ferrumequinum TaxID=59479 RepID=A0A7J7RJ45_RHIFE|nr:hypothetical protein mRhiFer1_009459 [Rhinolophus ferrumequinum]
MVCAAFARLPHRGRPGLKPVGSWDSARCPVHARPSPGHPHLPPLLRGLRKASPSAQMGRSGSGVPSPGPARGLPACVQGLTGAGGVGQTRLSRGLRQRGPWSPVVIHFPARAALPGRLQFSAEPGHSRGRLGSCRAGRDREGRILNQRETE